MNSDQSVTSLAGSVPNVVLNSSQFCIHSRESSDLSSAFQQKWVFVALLDSPPYPVTCTSHSVLSRLGRHPVWWSSQSASWRISSTHSLHSKMKDANSSSLGQPKRVIVEQIGRFHSLRRFESQSCCIKQKCSLCIEIQKITNPMPSRKVTSETWAAALSLCDRMYFLSCKASVINNKCWRTILDFLCEISIKMYVSMRCSLKMGDNHYQNKHKKALLDSNLELSNDGNDVTIILIAKQRKETLMIIFVFRESSSS